MTEEKIQNKNTQEEEMGENVESEKRKQRSPKQKEVKEEICGGRKLPGDRKPTGIYRKYQY